MNPQVREPWWKRAQRGQALLEYWPTIPAAIAVMIGASIIVSFLNGAFLRTANELDRYCPRQEAAPTQVEIYDHSVKATCNSYDPASNTTRVCFTVTSGTQPSISHWVLGIPKSVADHIISVSEQWAWTNSDPTTGAVGVKFDTGYESSGGGGGGKKAQAAGLVLASYRNVSTLAAGEILDTRTISMTLDGDYRFGTISIYTKAGADQVGTATINGPIAQIESKPDTNGIDRSKGC